MSAPVIQRCTPKKREAFLAALAETGNVLVAAKMARCARRTLYLHRSTNPAFAADWDRALATAMDLVLEPEAVRRAVEGVTKPIYHQGKKVGTVREYSDTLLIFLLKGGKPAKYRERYEHTGAEGTPLIPPAAAPDPAFFFELIGLFQQLGPAHGNGQLSVMPPSQYDELPDGDSSGTAAQ